VVWRCWCPAPSSWRSRCERAWSSSGGGARTCRPSGGSGGLAPHKGLSSLACNSSNDNGLHLHQPLRCCNGCTPSHAPVHQTEDTLASLGLILGWLLPQGTPGDAHGGRGDAGGSCLGGSGPVRVRESDHSTGGTPVTPGQAGDGGRLTGEFDSHTQAFEGSLRHGVESLFLIARSLLLYDPHRTEGANHATSLLSTDRAVTGNPCFSSPGRAVTAA
jgi:hypothetical protein